MDVGVQLALLWQAATEIYVDLAEVRSNLVELFGNIGGALLLRRFVLVCCPQCFDLCREASLFLGE